jgi:hypothetical protein
LVNEGTRHVPHNCEDSEYPFRELSCKGEH